MTDIALVHYTAPPVVGGVERVLGRHARLMADAGHTVRVVAGRGTAPDRRVRFERVPLADSQHDAVRRVAIELEAGRVPDAFGRLVEQLARELDRALAGAEVVIAHNVCSLNKNLALTSALHLISAGIGAPRLVLWHHDLAWTLPRYRASLHDGEPWDLLRQPWPGAIQVTISTSRRRDLATLMGLAPAEIRVIPDGVEVGGSAGVHPRTADLLRRAPLDERWPLLLLPARLTPRKNVELALRLVAAMRDAGRVAGLLVTGPVDPHDAAERGYLHRLQALRGTLGLDDAVWFAAELLPRALPEAAMADLFHIADALVLPSHDEGFGLPVLEAGLARLPVICSDLPALRALAGDEALYLEPDEAPATAAARVLERLEADPAARLARRVRFAYAWPKIYERHIAPLLAAAIA